MNKTLYTFLILFLGLTAASVICNSIISLWVGPEFYTLDAYVAWFLAVNITAFFGGILLLKYYHYRNYRFVFVTGIVNLITNLVYGIVVYAIITTGGLRSYNLPAFVINVGGIIVYAASLAFSETRKKTWLMLAGVCGLAVGLVLVAATVGAMYPAAIGVNSTLAKAAQWSPFALALWNVLMIVNFLAEIRTLKAGKTTAPRQEVSENLFGLAGIVGLIVTVATAVLMVGEGGTQLYWKKYNAQQAQQMVTLAGGAKTFVDGNRDSLHYILIKPQNYDPQKKYPLVVCLPYGGYEAAAAELLTEGSNRQQYPAFIFVPYCPDGQGWGGIPGYPSLDGLVYQAIDSLPEPGIDVNRRYVTGVSRGAYGVWQFICSRPDMFAAAMPVSGGGDPKLASNVIHIPIWDFHGAKDHNVPVSGSRDMIAAIKKAGGHPKYTEYPDEGHNIWDQVSKTPGLLDWLFSQKRE